MQLKIYVRDTYISGKLEKIFKEDIGIINGS